MSEGTPLDTQQKALAINLDRRKYGVFAEIGAGQEVARWFFRAGAASGTVAKSMSAYDMEVSDAIYGESVRYVSQDRLRHMLDHEWALLQKRLVPSRGKDTRFFVYANTVAARSYSRAEDGLGWMGVRYQREPGGPAHEVVLHTRLLDETNVQQQEVVGAVGVNLVHGVMEGWKSPEELIDALLDNVGPRRAEVGMIRFSGPDFEGVDNRLMSLELVARDLTRAALFDARGEVVHPTDVLHNKAVLLERGNFRPVTHATLHLIRAGLAQFEKDPEVHGDEVEVLFEMTLRHLRERGTIDHQDFLDRVDILGAVGASLVEDTKILVSNHAEFHRLAGYLFRYTKKPVGLVMGLPTLRELFKESFYEDLEGGILESFGRLFRNDLRLYVQPTLEEGNLVGVNDLRVARHLRLLYRHLLENGGIRALEEVREDYLPIHARDVLAQLRAGDEGWADMVPAEAATLIRQRGLLGHGASA